MTREEAIADIRDNIKPVVGGISLDMAIKALEQCEVWNGIHGQVVAPKGTFHKIWEDAEKAEQEPCEDCISRQAVINDSWELTYPDSTSERVVSVMDIEQLPSINPQEPKTIPVGAYEQVRWERDVAISQLKELGYSLGEKPRVDGKPILDKIRAEMKELIEWHDCPIELDEGNDAWYCQAVNRCMEIIDKYRQEG